MPVGSAQPPAQVGCIGATEGSFSGKGAQVLDLETKNFTSQVPMFNNDAGDTTADEDPDPAFNEIEASSVGRTTERPTRTHLSTRPPHLCL